VPSPERPTHGEGDDLIIADEDVPLQRRQQGSPWIESQYKSVKFD
jgi:hypothetical protein